MNVLYMSVPLAFVERATDSTAPIFFDIETDGLYTNVVLAQFKQEAWQEVLEVEYPNYKALQDFLRDKHIVSYPTAYDLGTMNISPRKIDDLYFAAKTTYPLLPDHGLATVCPEVFFGVAKNVPSGRHRAWEAPGTMTWPSGLRVLGSPHQLISSTCIPQTACSI